jgi:hypothetical protein
LLYALVHVEEIKGGLRRQNDDRMRVALFEEQRVVAPLTRSSMRNFSG